MNYRHAFHAGNFADVFKHAVLTLIISYLKEKPGAFRVIDTHAGSGIYDLGAPEPTRTGEWRAGIARLLAAEPTPPPVSDIVSPFLDIVRDHNPGGETRIYLGSPAIARTLLRAQDRLVACELHPQAFAILSRALAGDRRASAIAMDGWQALSALLPPPERRGLVLIDPPFEAENEFERLVDALATAHRKWATGIFMLWYPVKNRLAVEGFATKLTGLGISDILRAELFVAEPASDAALGGCGLMIVNPPWILHRQLSTLLPYLSETLRAGLRAMPPRLQWISDPA
jgi:23S rRNA (adenine2030-N6)-methyltransferase